MVPISEHTASLYKHSEDNALAYWNLKNDRPPKTKTLVPEMPKINSKCIVFSSGPAFMSLVEVAMMPAPNTIMIKLMAILARKSRRLSLFSRSLVMVPDAQNLHSTTSELKKSTKFSSPNTRHMADPALCWLVGLLTHSKENGRKRNTNKLFYVSGTLYNDSSQSKLTPSHKITYIVIENANCRIRHGEDCADPTEHERMLASRLTTTRHGASDAEPIPTFGSKIAD